MMTDVSDRFRRELSYLRDGVVAAISSDNIGDLKDGLALYEDLVEEVLSQFQAFSARAGGPSLGLRSAYGREMSWLEDDIRTFIRAAVTDASPDASHEVLSFLLGVVTYAYNRRELNAFGSLLRNYRYAWSVATAEAVKPGWTRTRSSILTTLENLGDYWIGRDLRGRAAETALPFGQRLVSEFAQLMKHSVDVGEPDDLRHASRHLRETFRYALERHPAARAPHSDEQREDEALAVILLDAKAMAIVGVEAWILLRVANDRTDRETAGQLLRLLRTGLPSVEWDTFVRSKRGEATDLFNWHWWETGLWEDRRGGVLTFDGFVDEAFVARLLTGGARVPLSIGEWDRGERHRLESLAALVEEIATTTPANPALSSAVSPEQAGAVKRQLLDLATQAQRAEDDALISLPLDPRLIAEFRDAVVEAWDSPRYLSQLLASEAWEPDEPDGSESDSSRPAPEAPSGFGVNMLVQKDFFVSRDGVHAPPANLGRDLGDALGRGEDELIIARLVEELPSSSTSLANLPAAASRLVRDLEGRGLSPDILVVNSWDIRQALGPLAADSAHWATSDRNDLPLARQRGVLRLRYVDTDDLCVVADLKAVAAVRYSAAQVDLAGDEVHAGRRVLTGVSPVDVARARELHASNPSLAQRDEEDATEDELIRRMQTLVEVRVLEWIRVEVKDVDAGHVLRVSDAR